MSGGPPHHPRQTPTANTAWNHLQVPNYFPTRQPQHAHMSNEHPLLHQPTWHTPTTEPMKPIPSSHLYNLEQMLNERQYPRHSPGVDLTLARNGSQANGDVSSAPISLSVRDANKINSLSASAMDMQSSEISKVISPGLKSISPGLKSASPGLKSASPALKPMSPGISTSPGLVDKSHGSPKNTKRSNIRVDSFLERLNPQERLANSHDKVGVLPQDKAQGIHDKLLHLDRTNEKLPSSLEKLPITVEKIAGPLPASITSDKIPAGLDKIPIPFDKLSGMLFHDKVSAELLQEKVTGLLQEKLNSNDKYASQYLSLLDKPATSVQQNLHLFSSSFDKGLEERGVSMEKVSLVPTEKVVTDKPIDKNPLLGLEGSKLDAILYNYAKGPFEKFSNHEQKLNSTDKEMGVIVQPSGSHDENSNSSSVANIPMREDDFSSALSNEDSLDNSGKSRRKRKPSKTVRVTKENKLKEDNEINNSVSGKLDAIFEKSTTEESSNERIQVQVQDSTQETSNSQNIAPQSSNSEENKSITSDVPNVPKETNNQLTTPSETSQTKDTFERLPTNENLGEILEGNKIPERRRSGSTEPLEEIIPRKTRRKTSSESETIANIAAMVHEGLSQKTEQPSNTGDVSSVPLATSEPEVQATSVTDQEKRATPEVVEDNTKCSNIVNQPPLSTPVVQTAAQRKATNFVEVENKLEEMFAGIDETLSDPVQTELPNDDFISDSINNASGIFTESEPTGSQNQDVTSTSTEVSPKKATPARKTPVKRGKKSDTEVSPKKRKTGKKSKKTPAKANKNAQKKGKKANGKQITTKVDNVKDVFAYDSGSNTSSSRSKGPFIQIKGPRDSPISVNIVNTPVNEEDEKKPPKHKKFHDDTEYRHKVRSKGLHCSTLSNKYDAQTRDATWICSFCKLGPHCPGFSVSSYPQGDLFGPYIIGTDASAEMREKCLEDPYDAQFKSKKAARAAEVVMAVKTPGSGKKSKRKHSESERMDNADNPLLGITETVDKTFEVWVHEDCIVWSPGVYLVGPKIVGLEEAVWTASNVKCSHCPYKGANVCCLRRGCANVAHIGCARNGSWQLDQANYKAYCPEHKTM